MAHLTNSTPNSTPLMGRHVRLAPLLSPIPSVSSLEYDSEFDDFVKRGDMVRKTMKMKYKKPRERVVEDQSPISIQKNYEGASESSLVTAPSLLTRWCSMRMDHSRPFGSELLESTPAPLKRTQSVYIRSQSWKVDEGKQFETEYPYVVWSKDESVKTPWTKAGEREYTLKKKKAIQKKKNSSKNESVRWSPLSYIRGWFFKTSRK